MSYDPRDDYEDYRFTDSEIEDIMRWEDVDSLYQIEDNTLIYEYNMCPTCHSKLAHKKEWGEAWGAPYYEWVIYCSNCGGV